MKKETLICAFALALVPTFSYADDFIATSNATVKVGKIRVDRNSATVNITVVNNASQMFSMIPIDCTALVNGEPFETNAEILYNLGPGQTAYGEVNFLTLEGRKDFTVSCRVAYIRTQ